MFSTDEEIGESSELLNPNINSRERVKSPIRSTYVSFPSSPKVAGSLALCILLIFAFISRQKNTFELPATPIIDTTTNLVNAIPPTAKPSLFPTVKPTFKPSGSPTFRPSAAPTVKPTMNPTTQVPTLTDSVHFKPSKTFLVFPFSY
jgi:hypothetical protein